MKWPEFLSGSYPAVNPYIRPERTVNLCPELVEATGEIALVHTPGHTPFITGLKGPLRGLFSQDGRCFAVGGDTFYEILSTGVAIVRGTVIGGSTLASMAINGIAGHQLFVIVGGNGYIFDLNTSVFTQITAGAFPASATMTAFLDGYFTVLSSPASQINLSSLFDGTLWNGLDVAQRSRTSDQIVALAEDHGEIWLFGTKRIEVWYDSGSASFPLAPVQGSLIEQGALPYSVQKFDNTLVWVSQNDRGGGSAYRANGYSAARMSTHAVEAQWRTYGNIKDVESFTYEENGHVFWLLNFPTAKRTWVYDASIQRWHERDWHNDTTGQFEQIRARCHTDCFDRHLVGDRELGTIYTQSLDVYNDNGVKIRKRRRAPHLRSEGKRVFFPHFRLGMNVGDGVADPTIEPQAILRWSDDGSKTFGPDVTAGLGLGGDYGHLVDWWMLGAGTNRVFELEIDDEIPVAIYEADIETTLGVH